MLAQVREPLLAVLRISRISARRTTRCCGWPERWRASIPRPPATC